MTGGRPAQRELTDRELAIVHAVARYRVLTGDQLQRVFFPVDLGISAGGALRRTQRTCKRLVDERHLDVLERRIGGVRAGSAGSAYVLGTAGQRLLRPSRRARSATSVGAVFVGHTLAVAEIAVVLDQAHQRREIDEVSCQPEPDCWRAFTRPDGQVDRLKPDLFVSCTRGEVERRWFIEVDRSTESLVRIESKCRHYLRYLATGREQELHGVFPKVLWTVPTERRLQQLGEVISGLPPPSDRLFTLCLQHNAIDHLKGGDT